MKILFISPASNIHTVRWVNALSKRGHEVHLAYLPNHSPSNDKINKNVILHKLKYSGSKGYYLNSVNLNKLYKSIKPDVVNTHYASGYGTLARLSRLKKLILSVWGSDIYEFPYQSKLNMHIIRKNLKYPGYIASTSFCMAEHTKKLIKEDKNIEITPFGVDVDKFKPMNKENNKEKFVFGIVKTLEANYGIEYLIEAYSIVLKKLHENGLEKKTILKIYGRGPNKNKLKDLCRRLDISENVEFKGYIPNIEVPKAINDMDIFCLSSISESFGVAAVEAMACGVPVISTDADGFKEVIINGQTGYIVKKENSELLANKMYELMLDDNKREEFAKQGRDRVIKKYDWEDNVGHMEKLYQKVKLL